MSLISATPPDLHHGGATGPPSSVRHGGRSGGSAPPHRITRLVPGSPRQFSVCVWGRTPRVGCRFSESPGRRACLYLFNNPTNL